MACQSVFVVAIDFGTSYSGYCFSLASGTDQIRQVYWGAEHGLKTPKTPTSILFNQNQEFKHFGYDAVMKYKSLPSSQADSWYFFQNFKMQLYNTVGVIVEELLLVGTGAIHFFERWGLENPGRGLSRSG